MQSAGWMKQVIEHEKPRRVFVDVGGVGSGVYDPLCEMGFGEIVRLVNFGSASMEPPALGAQGQPSGEPVNWRAEMWAPGRSVYHLHHSDHVAKGDPVYHLNNI